jgi:hypothetical protein
MGHDRIVAPAVSAGETSQWLVVEHEALTALDYELMVEDALRRVAVTASSLTRKHWQTPPI